MSSSNPLFLCADCQARTSKSWLDSEGFKCPHCLSTSLSEIGVLPPMPTREEVMSCAEFFASKWPLGALWDVVNELHRREKERRS